MDVTDSVKDCLKLFVLLLVIVAMQQLGILLGIAQHTSEFCQEMSMSKLPTQICPW